MRFLFRWCEPEPIETGPKYDWVFQHGTVVRAHTYDAAVRRLKYIHTKHFWAVETQAEIWDVQFDEDVVVENVKGQYVSDAAENARFYLREDIRYSKVIRTSCPDDIPLCLISTSQYQD